MDKTRPNGMKQHGAILTRFSGNELEEVKTRMHEWTRAHTQHLSVPRHHQHALILPLPLLSVVAMATV